MRARLRLLTAFAAAGTAVSGISGCGLSDKTFEDDSTLTRNITSVRLESGSGAITLRGAGGATEVKLHRSVEYGGDRPAGATHRVEGGVLVLRGCGDDCAVTYTVDLPAGVAVTGETSSGAISLSRAGAVKVKTGSGAIDLDDIDGTVEVQSSSGAITGSGLHRGPVRATTSSGAIALELSSPQDVEAEADAGAVTVTVPDGRYRVHAKSDSGGKDIAVSDDPSGAHRLDLTTSSGAITVKRS